MKKLSALLLLAFAVALGFFCVIYTAGNHFIDSYIELGKVNEALVERFSRHIQEEHISTGDDEALYKWCSANRGVDIEVFKEGKLVFTSIGNVKKMGVSVRETELDEKRAVPIEFEDAVADVVIYDGQRLYDTSIAVCIMASVIIFFIIIVMGMSREVDYIKTINDEIHVLEGGDLSKEITIRGDDEISMLAESVDEFRKSMKNQLGRIEQLEKNSRMISAEIAHDLRTPLTSLIMYLDFALEEMRDSESQAEEYIIKAKERSVRLKDLFDENFSYTTMTDYFMKEKQEVPPYVILNGYLNELIVNLESQGFNVRSEISFGRGNILIQGEALGRIFGNIVSNIRKYACKDSEVRIFCRDKEKYLEIRIENAIRVFEGEKPESTGFGSRIIRRLMKEMDGEYYAEEADGRYATELHFSKASHEAGKRQILQ